MTVGYGRLCVTCRIRDYDYLFKLKHLSGTRSGLLGYCRECLEKYPIGRIDNYTNIGSIKYVFELELCQENSH